MSVELVRRCPDCGHCWEADECNNCFVPLKLYCPQHNEFCETGVCEQCVKEEEAARAEREKREREAVLRAKMLREASACHLAEAKAVAQELISMLGHGDKQATAVIGFVDNSKRIGERLSQLAADNATGSWEEGAGIVKKLLSELNGQEIPTSFASATVSEFLDRHKAFRIKEQEEYERREATHRALACRRRWRYGIASVLAVACFVGWIVHSRWTESQRDAARGAYAATEALSLFPTTSPGRAIQAWNQYLSRYGSVGYKMVATTEWLLFLGDCRYEKGDGVPKDVAKAIGLYQKAAAGDNRYAALRLGDLFQQGVVVPRDLAKAAQYYRESWSKGCARAAARLGEMYTKGEGVPKDMAKAVELYRKAADAGEPIGLFNLGIMYDNGWGVPKDPANAMELYRMAARAGDQGAINYLRSIGSGW